MPDDGNKSLADKLASYRSLLLKANAPLVGDHPQDIASPGVKSAPPPADRADPSRPPVLTIEHRFPTAYRHGHYRFDRLNEVFEAWPDLEIAARFPSQHDEYKRFCRIRTRLRPIYRRRDALPLSPMSSSAMAAWRPSAMGVLGPRAVASVDAHACPMSVLSYGGDLVPPVAPAL